MSILFARASAFGCLVALAFGLLAAYGLQLAETNEYMGYVEFSFDVPYIVALVAAIFFIGMLMPVEIRSPSDFFTFLYGLFVLLPYAILFPIRSPVELLDFTLFFSALAGPFVAVSAVTGAVPPLRVPRLISQKALVFMLVLLCVIGVFIALSNPTASAGFDLATSYERRMQGREIFPTGTPLAYLNAAIVNGFAPYLAFVAGWQRRAWLIALSLFCGLAFFYLLGLKAPLLFITLASVIGYSVRIERVHTIARTIYILMFITFFLFLLEYMFFGYSLIGDYFVRRAFSVPAWMISVYFEFMASGSRPAWLPLGGVSSTEPITFIVGEGFLGRPGLNANTNAFLYQLAAGGVPMYLLTILLVTFVFALLDAAYKCKRNPTLIYLGFAYAILLTEQAATTALMSSGIGVLVMLVVFSGSGEETNPLLRVRRPFVKL